MKIGPSLRKLLDISSSPFLSHSGASQVGLERFGENGIVLRDLLLAKNGFFCFESALRLFPVETCEASWGLTEWNQHDLWKSEYHGLADGLFCFAEDIFGGQFGISGRDVVTLNPETGETEILTTNLEEWASIILDDYNLMTGYQFAHDWQEKRGPMKARDRLMPKKPFVLGGDYDISNLTALDSLKVMKNLGNLARQIHDLPDGSQIQFQVL